MNHANGTQPLSSGAIIIRASRCLVANCTSSGDDMVALLGLSMAIYAADILWRRNRYDDRDLTDETHGGPFWYTAGVNWAGVIGKRSGARRAVCVRRAGFGGCVTPGRGCGGLGACPGRSSRRVIS